MASDKGVFLVKSPLSSPQDSMAQASVLILYFFTVSENLSFQFVGTGERGQELACRPEVGHDSLLSMPMVCICLFLTILCLLV